MYEVITATNSKGVQGAEVIVATNDPASHCNLVLYPLKGASVSAGLRPHEATALRDVLLKAYPLEPAQPKIAEVRFESKQTDFGRREIYRVTKRPLPARTVEERELIAVTFSKDEEEFVLASFRQREGL